MFTKTMNVTRCSVEKESEKYNIFIFTEEDGQNFYIERKGYDNLYYICNVPEKDKLDNSLKFIEENIDKLNLNQFSECWQSSILFSFVKRCDKINLRDKTLS